MVFDKGYEEYTLDNGLVVALQRTPTQTVAGRLKIHYGAFHEEKGEEGLAHFLEHCLVSGGSEKYSPLAADLIRESFGYSNAFTGLDKIGFEAQMLTEDLETWLNYVSDHTLNPLFDAQRVEGEKGRVLREISDAKSRPNYLQRMEFKSAFYQGHPKGRFTLGAEEIVANAGQDKIRQIHSRGFHPNNMSLVLVGDLPKNIRDIIYANFGNAPQGPKVEKPIPSAIPLSDQVIMHRSRPEMLNRENPSESSAEFLLTCHCPAIKHPDEYAIRVMSDLLGFGTNSLLFRNVGLDKGLAYSINTAYCGDYNFGEWDIHAGVPANRIDEAREAVFEEIKKIKSQKMPRERVDFVKKKVMFNIANTLESNRGQMEVISSKLNTGVTPSKVMAGFAEVTPERVQEVANTHIPDPDGNYLLYIGDPLKE